ncbi:zinc finger C2HC domain-containing protein 1A-like isoform X2 [Oppia nitens]|uniref:zinc finger C2HC domain-containing protein 1A-like isoform X2 n=1 Tax=Oppia nitens TaxID=1686743 RepID=UPI0023DBFFCA|nr:zinc finger C2HC domain-containing protein 1A-like isoform X2 [Oppia nitens]
MKLKFITRILLTKIIRETHKKICNKTRESQKRRKVFNSHKQRAELENVNGFPITPPSRQTTSEPKPAVNKKADWRAKHEEFLRTVRAARGEKVDEPEANGDLGAHRVPVGYIVCDYCGRNFSEKAADRHIEWCKEQKARIPRSANNAKALERMKARTKYKPTKNNNNKVTSPKTESPPKTMFTGSRTSSSSTGTTTSMSRSYPSPAAPKRPTPPNSLKTSPVVKPRNTRRITPSPPSKSKFDQKRIQSLSRPKNTSPDSIGHMLKQTAPVMKFKEKFPNHTNATRLDTNFIIKNGHLTELMKKSEKAYDSSPRTVPGVRTGGMSPVKSEILSNHQNGHYTTSNNNNNNLRKNNFDKHNINNNNNDIHDNHNNQHNDNNNINHQFMSDEEELAKLKARIEEMYLNGSPGTGIKPKSNAIVINGSTLRNNHQFEANHNSESTTRGSTGGSSAESSSITTPPPGTIQRDITGNSGSADSVRSQASSTGSGTGLPKFCHQCGTKYPSTIAKYCYECGSRRLGTVGPFIAT